MEAAASTCERIGHGGASALAPANTLASFDAALDVGVDMVEFDVRGRQGELVLAHTVLRAQFPGGLRLREALAHLSSRPFADVQLNVDLKRPGCEAALLAGLRSAGLLERTRSPRRFRRFWTAFGRWTLGSGWASQSAAGARNSLRWATGEPTCWPG